MPQIFDNIDLELFQGLRAVLPAAHSARSVLIVPVSRDPRRRGRPCDRDRAGTGGRRCYPHGTGLHVSTPSLFALRTV